VITPEKMKMPLAQTTGWEGFQICIIILNICYFKITRRILSVISSTKSFKFVVSLSTTFSKQKQRTSFLTFFYIAAAGVRITGVSDPRGGGGE